MPLLRIILCLLASLVLFGSLPARSAESVSRPNLVFILADDLGWTDLACQGSKFYETPNIDRLAREGMRFTDGYTCGPNCQPTRAALMSGQYGPRTGIYTVGSTDRFDTGKRPLIPVPNVLQLALDKITVAEALKKHGYTTGHFGKWHLGNNKFGPDHQGFDESLVSMGKHFNFSTIPPVTVPEGTYLADYLTDRAIAFLEKNKDRPFFVQLNHFAVHSPHQAKKDLIARFQNKPGVNGHKDPTYAAMIASVDESVGRVLKKLEDLKLDRKTLVIFSSDNGGVGGYIEAAVNAREGITNNAPLRGGKGMLYEGGIRVPWIFRWPGQIQAATLCAEPILSVDFYPTLLDLAGGTPDPGYPLDGVSLTSLLFGKKTKLDRSAIFWHFPGYLGSGKDVWRTTPAGAMRMGDWKLQEFFEDNRLELYNLREDIGEKNNRIKDFPDRAQEMHTRLKSWREEVKAPMPMRRSGQE